MVISVTSTERLMEVEIRETRLDHAEPIIRVLGTYVDLACRRQGIATQLFQATFAAAIRKGYEKVFTFVRADSVAGLQAYLAEGSRNSLSPLALQAI